MNSLKEFLQRDEFVKHCGIELVSLAPGHAVTRLKVQPWHLNAVGIVQGGAIFTLADYAFAVASNSHGTVAVGINVGITYIKSATAGTLTAEAQEVALNPKLASYTVNVTDDAHSLIAIFQGLVYRKQQAIGGEARS
ncbi:MAG TPA: PaaI family thioesterase [Opitutaceae bacterium]|nr:PaaI family thioesterase [Opitutaceae bacterium]